MRCRRPRTPVLSSSSAACDVDRRLVHWTGSLTCPFCGNVSDELGAGHRHVVNCCQRAPGVEAVALLSAGPSGTSSASASSSSRSSSPSNADTVFYTNLRAHETGLELVCRLLLEKKKKQWFTPTNLGFLILIQLYDTRMLLLVSYALFFCMLTSLSHSSCLL